VDSQVVLVGERLSADVARGEEFVARHGVEGREKRPSLQKVERQGGTEALLHSLQQSLLQVHVAAWRFVRSQRS